MPAPPNRFLFSPRHVLEKHAFLADLRDLLRLAVPVIGSTFMSVAYHLINMIFVGKLGSSAIAAVGTAGFFLNLGWALSSLPATGTGIKVSHAIGRKNNYLSRTYVKNGLNAVLVLGIAYTLVILAMKKPFIGFFDLNHEEIETTAISYLAWMSLSIPFTFLNFFFSNVFFGYGESRIPFRINLIGLSVNIVLDYLLIFPVGMGVLGAAAATVISQVLICILYWHKLKQTEALNPHQTPFRKTLLVHIVRLGISPAMQRTSFVLIAILMAKIISEWGATAIAVQKVGVQIEALTFMTVSGFGTALSSLSGQAFGAGRYQKQWDYYKAGFLSAAVIGIFTGTLFILSPEPLIRLFFHEKESILMGNNYLRILGYSQIFMCLEILTAGAFYGFGKTHIPALTSVSLTALRIPLALFLIYPLNQGLSGAWWSISISSMAKGSLLSILFVIILHRFLKNHPSKP